MTDWRSTLSPEGIRRSSAIIELAGQALEERTRRRRTRRAAGATLALGCAALVLLMRGPAREPVIVADKPITEFVPFKEANVEMLSDADLARELNSVGFDAGVASFNGEVHLIASDGTRVTPPLVWNAPRTAAPTS